LRAAEGRYGLGAGGVTSGVAVLIACVIGREHAEWGRSVSKILDTADVSSIIDSVSMIVDIVCRVGLDRSIGVSASFQEKSVWVQLVATLAAAGTYLVLSVRMLPDAATSPVAHAVVFGVAVGLMVLVIGIGHGVAAWTTRVEEQDERDRLIEWKSESRSAWLLVVGMLLALTALIARMESVAVMHILVSSLFVTAIVGFVLRLVYYRRGLGRGVR
jgi:hypothetical protein